MPPMIPDRRDSRVSPQRPPCNNGDGALLVAVHDVAPVHVDRIERAERLLSRLGVSAATYLFVPDFHGGGAADRDREFVGWCRSARPYAVRWFLHGYFHREDPPSGNGVPPTVR